MTSSKAAFERLKSIIREEKCNLDEDTMASIQRDIGNIILKYVDIELDDIDVKVMIQSKSKQLLF